MANQKPARNTGIIDNAASDLDAIGQMSLYTPFPLY
jgi:hypothetical protein